MIHIIDLLIMTSGGQENVKSIECHSSDRSPTVAWILHETSFKFGDRFCGHEHQDGGTLS